MRIIDSHLHLIYLDKFDYGWLSYVPAINRQADAPSYFAEAEKLGIEAAIHMEAGVAAQQSDDETAFALAVDPRVRGAITAAMPEHVDFPAHLERIAANPRIKGIRRILQAGPDDLAAGEVFRANLRRIATYGLTFDITAQSRQLPVARDLAAACPDVQFVLDHCGNPQIAKSDLADWRRDLKALAALPNVVGKVSGIVNHARPDYTTDDLRPVVEYMIECFGWDRVVWGSDRPVVTLNGTLTKWVETTKAIVAGASPDEQARLFHRNAERLYRLAGA